MSTRAYVYAGSILVHAGIAAAVVGIRPPTFVERVTITLNNVPPPPPPKPPPPPEKKPEPPLEKPLQAPKPAPRPPTPKAAPPPTVAAPAEAPAPEFGVQLAGASGPGGIAVPVGNPTASPVRRVQPRVLTAEAPKAVDACTDPPAKPKPLQVSQPAYPEDARAAGIQGRVRVELTVDSSGAVAHVRIVEGLGHGLDEAALEAARTYRFEPAIRCGKAVAATFTIAIRFTL